ncbi:hypothetical protein BGZ65_001624, partial [Modicella reniformis]
MVGPNLTVLQIKDMKHSIQIPIDGILVLCPKLVTLYIRCSCISYYHKDLEPASPELGLPNRLKLRSLTLEEIGIEEMTLLRLLKSCPDLEELRLMRCLFYERSTLDRISGLCRRLLSVHFSSFACSSFWMTSDIKGVIWKLKQFPRVKEWSFTDKDISPRLYTAFKKCGIDDHLTSLELLESTPASIQVHGYSLHKFLCRTPHLLHLKIPVANFSVRWFDLEGILAPFGMSRYNYAILQQTLRTASSFSSSSVIAAAAATSAVAPYHRMIWACRNLRTLHLQCYFANDTSVENARVMFGYLSRVCPRLQDLEISRGSLTLAFESGLCLLTRLHELQRLKLKIAWCGQDLSQNAEWISRHITPELRTSLNQNTDGFPNRKTIYARRPFKSTGMPLRINDMTWRGSNNVDHKNEEEDGDEENDEDEKSSSHKKTYDDSDPDYMIDEVDMRNVGQWKDITDLFQDRFSQNWCCWPQMEYFEIQSPISSNDLDEWKESIRRIRPEIETRLVQVIEKDSDEQDRLKVLTTDVIRAFKRDEIKDVKAITEVVYLSPVLDKDTFKDLLKEFYKGIDQAALLDVHQLEGLAQLVQGAGP